MEFLAADSDMKKIDAKSTYLTKNSKDTKSKIRTSWNWTILVIGTTLTRTILVIGTYWNWTMSTSCRSIAITRWASPIVGSTSYGYIGWILSMLFYILISLLVYNLISLFFQLLQLSFSICSLLVNVSFSLSFLFFCCQFS